MTGERPRRVPRLTLGSVARAAALMGVLWGGGMAFVFAGPFARVVPTAGGVTLEARERTFPELVRAVVPFVLGGALFGLAMGAVLLVAARQARKQAAAAGSTLGLAPGEVVLEDGPANRLQRAAIGGWLYLTDRRLLFRPHRMNLGMGSPLDLPLLDVAEVSPCATAWILPTGLRIGRRGGGEERFVVGKAAQGAWVAAIADARGAPPPESREAGIDPPPSGGYLPGPRGD